MSIYDIRRMQMLLEIQERGTIIAAAEALSLTPSAVSQQIATLEKETGTPLLQRIGRRVQLTSAGLIIVDSARSANSTACKPPSPTSPANPRAWSASPSSSPRPSRCYRKPSATLPNTLPRSPCKYCKSTPKPAPP